MDKIKKTLEYRRASFNTKNGQVLEDLVRNAWGQFGTHVERTVDIGDGRSYSGLRASNGLYTGFAIHCGRFTDNQSMGTIPQAPSRAAAVGVCPPPAGENFLDFDLMAYIKGNEVICLSCGVNASRLTVYLRELIKKASLEDQAGEFILNKVSDYDKISLIKEHGVKKIDLGLSVSDALADRLVDYSPRKGNVQSFKHAATDIVRSVFHQYEPLKELQKSDEEIFKVTIDVMGRNVEPARQDISEFAKKIVDDEEIESFAIHLKDGSIIRSDEMSVKKSVMIEALAKSVDVHNAWKEMDTYMDEVERDQIGSKRDTA